MQQPMITGPMAEHIKGQLTKLNLWKKKEELVREFSAGNRVHDMTQAEADKLIGYLNELIPRADNMRKTLLSLGYQLHWDVARSSAEQAMEPKRVNYNRVNAWCQSPNSKHKKSLARLDPFELNDMVTQLKQVLEATKKLANGEIRKQA
jgi:hypothetical protein